jgi:hypothetical protein
MAPKVCGNCSTRYDLEAWSRLPLCGYQPHTDTTAGELLELRSCPCGSTMAMDVGDGPDTLSEQGSA